MFLEKLDTESSPVGKLKGITKNPMNRLNDIEEVLQSLIRRMDNKNKRDKKLYESEDIKPENMGVFRDDDEECGQGPSLNKEAPKVEAKGQKESPKQEFTDKKRVVLQPQSNDSTVRKKPRLKAATLTFDKNTFANNLKFSDEDSSISYYNSQEGKIPQMNSMARAIEQGNLEKTELLDNLQKDLNMLSQTGKNANEESLDEAINNQIDQTEDRLNDFLEEYEVEDEEDEDLEHEVKKFEDKLQKSKSLVENSKMFDPKSKRNFLKGVFGLIEKSTNDFVKEVESVKERQSSKISQTSAGNISEVSFSRKNFDSRKSNYQSRNRDLDFPMNRSSFVFMPDAPNNSIYNSRRVFNNQPSFEEHKATNSNGYNKVCLVNPSHSRNGETSRRTLTTQRSKGILKNASPRPAEEQKEPETRTLLEVDQTEGMITALKLVDNENLAISFSTGCLCLYRINDQMVVWSSKQHSGPISSIEVTDISFNTRKGLEFKRVILTGGSEDECSILVWDAETSEVLKKLSGHSHLVSGIIGLGDNACIATGSFDSKIAIWDLTNSFNCIQLLEQARTPILCMDFNKEDETFCAGCLDGSVLMYKVFYKEEPKNYHGCALMKVIKMEGHIIEATRFSGLPDLMVSLQSDFEVKIHAMQSGKLLRTFKGPHPFVDFIIVRSEDTSPILFCIDNMSNIFRFENWPLDGGKSVAGEPAGGAERARIQQFLGISPKTQVMIKDENLFMIMPDQSKLNLVVQQLNIQ